MIPVVMDGTIYRVRIGALPGAPHLARRFIKDLMEKWSLSIDIVEAAELLTSELVTNALRATGRDYGEPGPLPDERVRTIEVRARATPVALTVAVWDSSPEPPAPTNADDEAECGRGLFLVGALADRWGSGPAKLATQGEPGKIVWFGLALTPTPPSSRPAAIGPGDSCLPLPASAITPRSIVPASAFAPRSQGGRV
jgi:anti-sigma regulatory factor (Ser/Thr protein kinase)